MSSGRVAATCLLMLASLAVADDDRNAVTGYWASPESILRVAVIDGSLSMQVVALLEPHYAEGEEFGPVGAPRRDDLNPDPDQRHRPIIGLELLSGYAFADGKWRGRIYDPETGNIYSSSMSMGRNGQLRMRGYIGLPMFGRTQNFLPVHACTAEIVTMLQTASLDGCE